MRSSVLGDTTYIVLEGEVHEVDGLKSEAMKKMKAKTSLKEEKELDSIFGKLPTFENNLMYRVSEYSTILKLPAEKLKTFKLILCSECAK